MLDEPTNALDPSAVILTARGAAAACGRRRRDPRLQPPSRRGGPHRHPDLGHRRGTDDRHPRPGRRGHRARVLRPRPRRDGGGLMSTFLDGLAVETRKARSSRVLWSTGLLLVLGAVRSDGDDGCSRRAAATPSCWPSWDRRRHPVTGPRCSRRPPRSPPPAVFSPSGWGRAGCTAGNSPTARCPGSSACRCRRGRLAAAKLVVFAGWSLLISVLMTVVLLGAGSGPRTGRAGRCRRRWARAAIRAGCSHRGDRGAGRLGRVPRPRAAPRYRRHRRHPRRWRRWPCWPTSLLGCRSSPRHCGHCNRRRPP